MGESICAKDSCCSVLYESDNIRLGQNFSSNGLSISSQTPCHHRSVTALKTLSSSFLLFQQKTKTKTKKKTTTKNKKQSNNNNNNKTPQNKNNTNTPQQTKTKTKTKQNKTKRKKKKKKKKRRRKVKSFHAKIAVHLKFVFIFYTMITDHLLLHVLTLPRLFSLDFTLVRSLVLSRS